MKKLNDFTLGEKIVLASVLIAFVSLFFNWIDVGVASANGFNQQGYLLLIFFIYPVIAIIKNMKYNSIIGIVLGALALIAIFIFIQSKTVDFFGEKLNGAASGMYLFLFSCIGFIVGNVLIKKASVNNGNTNSHETIESDSSTDDSTAN